MDELEINKRFDHHAPNGYKVNAHEELRGMVKTLAKYLGQSLPESREKSLAITHLEEVLMWGNAAIARND